MQLTLLKLEVMKGCSHIFFLLSDHFWGFLPSGSSHQWESNESFFPQLVPSRLHSSIPRTTNMLWPTPVDSLPVPLSRSTETFPGGLKSPSFHFLPSFSSLLIRMSDIAIYFLTNVNYDTSPVKNFPERKSACGQFGF